MLFDFRHTGLLFRCPLLLHVMMQNGDCILTILFLSDHVTVKFGVDSSQIKTAIRTKLNNEDKLLKKRLGLGKAENKAMIDPNLCQDASLLPDNEVI